MQKFEVAIFETRKYVIEVEAESADDACMIVNHQYNTGKQILPYNYTKNAEIEAV